MLIQLDGRHRGWISKGRPLFTLLPEVDDATGTVGDVLFCELENIQSCFLLIEGLIRRRDIPLALYVDRRAVFKYTPSQETAAAPA